MQMLVHNLHMSNKEKVSHHPQCASSKFHSYLHNPDAASNHNHHIAPVKHMQARSQGGFGRCGRTAL